MRRPDARCNVCGCTEERACEGGCCWNDASATLCSRCSFLKPGQPVWYYPNMDSRRAFAAVVESEPRKLGEDWVVRLEGLGPEYGEACHGGKQRTTVTAAYRLALRPREPLHETMRQLLLCSTEVLAEQELNGQLSASTIKHLQWAVRHAEKALVPTRGDCK